MEIFLKKMCVAVQKVLRALPLYKAVTKALILMNNLSPFKNIQNENTLEIWKKNDKK